MAHQAIEEIIEDSEPERIQRRALSATRLGVRSPIEVIEISDSDSSPSRSLRDVSPSKCPHALPDPPSPDSPRVKSFAIKHLAYSQPPKPPTQPNRPLHSESSINKQFKTPYHRASTPVNIFDVSNTSIAKLNKCIGCEISWTARKTVPQKLVHIEVCARQRGYNKETVRVLIQNELAKTEPQKKASSTGRKKNTASPSLKETTYMEDVLQVGASKRPKGSLTETVIDVSQTRQDILIRAKGLLFAKASEDALHLDDICNVVADNFPLTQPFRASTLGGIERQVFCDEVTGGRALAHIRSVESRSLFDASRSDYGEVRDNSQSKPPDCVQTESHPIGTSLSRDASLNGGPSAETMGFGQSMTPTKKSPGRKPNTPIPTAQRARILVSEPAAVAKPVTKAATGKCRSPRSKKSSMKKSKPTLGKDWETHMKQAIRRDINLYQQVLRYEPICFDIFLELAETYTENTPQMRRQLQAFLDDQAILFYGAEGIAWK